MLVNVVGDSRRTAWVNSANQQLKKAVLTESRFDFWRPLCLMFGVILPLITMAGAAGSFSAATNGHLRRFIWIEAALAIIVAASLTAYLLLRRRYRQAVQTFRQGLQDGEALDTGSCTYGILNALFYTVYARPMDRLVRADFAGGIYATIRPYVIDAQAIERQLNDAKDSERLRLCSELIKLAEPYARQLIQLDVISQQASQKVREELLALLEQNSRDNK